MDGRAPARDWETWEARWRTTAKAVRAGRVTEAAVAAAITEARKPTVKCRGAKFFAAVDAAIEGRPTRARPADPLPEYLRPSPPVGCDGAYEPHAPKNPERPRVPAPRDPAAEKAERERLAQQANEDRKRLAAERAERERRRRVWDGLPEDVRQEVFAAIRAEDRVFASSRDCDLVIFALDHRSPMFMPSGELVPA
jgi:hypothetical protein